MKKYYLIILLMCLTQMLSAQTLLAKWSIPTGTFADSLADGGIVGNISTKVLKAVGTTAIDFSKNGYAGTAAQATQWDNGNGVKYWQIEVTTTGYSNIKLSSRQQSGNPLTNPGPRDFKLQYKLGTAGTWTDIPNGNIKVLNNWDTSYVNNLVLPVACNEAASVFVRWIMRSNMSDNNTNDVLTTGTSKIDDILVYGDVSAGVQQVSNNSFNIYPNPLSAGNNINISTEMFVNSVEVFDITGKSVLMNEISNTINNLMIDIRSLKPGMYFIKVNSEGKVSSKKIIIY
jgi:hypothetical protein